MLHKNDVIQAKNRLIAFVALAAILAVMLFSSCYMVSEADHDCSGTACPVCAVIQQCEDNLRKLGAGQISVISAAVAFCLICQTIASIRTIVTVETLITQKVRLNN